MAGDKGTKDKQNQESSGGIVSTILNLIKKLLSK